MAEGIDLLPLGGDVHDPAGVLARCDEAAMAVEVSEVRVAHEIGSAEPPVLESSGGELGQRRSAVIAAVADVHRPVRCDGELCRKLELARATAESTHLSDELPGAGEHLDAAVAGVGDVDPALVVDGDLAVGHPESSRPGAFPAKDTNHLSGGCGLGY